MQFSCLWWQLGLDKRSRGLESLCCFCCVCVCHSILAHHKLGCTAQAEQTKLFVYSTTTPKLNRGATPFVSKTTFQEGRIQHCFKGSVQTHSHHSMPRRTHNTSPAHSLPGFAHPHLAAHGQLELAPVATGLQRSMARLRNLRSPAHSCFLFLNF